ncbi:MAG: hypothetical protein E7589_04080 [Ruminococcaceae bacterium]|nr:hypothetical protein [Oscillospiraceae bacterium]
MTYKYIVVRNTYHNKAATRVGFGIAAVEEYDMETTVLESIPDLSANIKDIERLVELCNRNQLDIVHLKDVATDFLETK